MSTHQRIRHQRVRPWQRAIRWVYTKRGTIVLGVPVLLMAIVSLYEFWRGRVVRYSSSVRFSCSHW